MIRDLSCTEFTEILASREPAPGGGGASALVLAMSAALGNMVGELTVGKKKYAENEDRIKELMARTSILRERLLILIDKDAEDFLPLSKAYAIPKDDPHRDEELERCLKLAMNTPLEVFNIACECIELQKEFAEKGSMLMISDAATGVSFARGALQGAAVNVRVNTRLMKDRAFADDIDREIAEKLSEYEKMSDEVFYSVMNRLG